MPSESDDDRLVLDGENGRPGLRGACRKIDDAPALLPFGDCFLVDPVALSEGSPQIRT
jgi:hypothetical protein